jgi:Flp pilus assembly protein protease CpaA
VLPAPLLARLVTLAALAVACAWDLRARRVPNALTFGALAVVLLLQPTASCALSAAGCAVLMFIGWPAGYRFGGADVKLAALAGAALGPVALLVPIALLYRASLSRRIRRPAVPDLAVLTCSALALQSAGVL